MAEAGRADTEPLVAAAINAGLSEQQARRTIRSAYVTIARGAPVRSRDSAVLQRPVPLSQE